MSICHPPADWSCAFTPDQLATMRQDARKAAMMERAEGFAWLLLAAKTAYSLGICPTTVRPCVQRRVPDVGFLTAPVGPLSSSLPLTPIGFMNPYISGGVWYNACGCTSGCGCDSLSEVQLPGPVGQILEVMVGGVALPRSAYRVDNGDRLVRVDGGRWPLTQDMSQDDGGPDAFSVTYYRGAAPNILVAAAAGALAAEFYNGCTGGPCRLPDRLTSIVRNGESYELEPMTFEGPLGVPEADAIIQFFNPHGHKTRPGIAMPGAQKTRVTTWR